MSHAPHAKTIEVEIGGKKLKFETGRIARQAGGAVLLHQDDTIVMATACMAPGVSPDADFLPLKVDYQEKFSAIGKTLGGYIKREGRPTERETLISRLIDRPIRPMFPDGFFHETQVLAYVLSYDGVHIPDVLAICATSAALTISEIPFFKPIGAVRVGMIDGKFIINPTLEETKVSKLDLVLAGTHEAILMIEGFCDFLTEDQVLDAIETGHNEIKKICDTLSKWGKEVGKEKITETLRVLPSDLISSVEQIAASRLTEALKLKGKQVVEQAVEEIRNDVLNALCPPDQEATYSPLDVAKAFKKVHAKQMRSRVINEGIRADGRSTTDIRPIWIEQNPLPRTHGSSLFTRGETQTLAVCTLGGASMAQRYEMIDESGSKNFYLQYFFPPFSVGEVGRVGAPGRREVGHGKLAERALQVAIPPQEEFPYVVRLESNITESNGSSSMASVCGGCLAMMEAGVPIKRPVSGIAMGLILEDGKATILSDILGLEDFLGDMDFKVTGDADGITAFQMDIKIEGITHDIMASALKQAKAGRIHILDKMLEACPAPKAEMSKHAPRIETIKIHPSKIGAVIGPGGKQIRAIVEETGVEVDINDDGLISLASSSVESMERAKAIIHGITAEIEVGATYKGVVKAVVPFGCFVEVLPGKEGLCHISELDNSRVEDINAFIKEGDKIEVKVLDINERGQVKLSRKALLTKEKG